MKLVDVSRIIEKLNRIEKAFFKKILDAILKKYIDEYIHNYLLTNKIVWGDPKRMSIAKTAVLNNPLINLSSGNVVIEDYVFFGHNVSLLTGTHDYKKTDSERQLSAPKSGRDIIIKRGAWIATNATIIGPCIIGEHSVVAACSLVNSDVPPMSVVAGVPAKVIKYIEPYS
jgi:acetyltransferase-like isoleucine patch superfamily enzyme